MLATAAQEGIVGETGGNFEKYAVHSLKHRHHAQEGVPWLVSRLTTK